MTSVLDDLGQEITGIAFPVAACMALTVLLVRVLNPEGDSSGSTVYIASIAYSEQAGDSAGAKLGGALLNAVIFISVIAGMTFVLFLLFKYRCYKVIYGYMAFALFNIFFFLTGAISIQLLKKGNVHMDAFSLVFLLFNFSVVGILGMFFMPVPLLLKQCYTVWVGIITAYLFTYIPEWTSWVLLVLMAVYDLVAVLMPGGPLKILVEMAVERQQELPALIYEARPVGRPYQRGHWARRAQAADVAQAGSPSQTMALLDEAERGPLAPGTPTHHQQQQAALRARPGATPMAEGMELSTASPPSPQRPLLQHIASSSSSPSGGGSPGAGRLRNGARAIGEGREGVDAGAERLRGGARAIAEGKEGGAGSAGVDGASMQGSQQATRAGAGAAGGSAERTQGRRADAEGLRGHRPGPLGEGIENGGGNNGSNGRSRSGASGSVERPAGAAGEAAATTAAAGLSDAVLPQGLAPIRTSSGVQRGASAAADWGSPLHGDGAAGADGQGAAITRRGSRQRIGSSQEEPGQPSAHMSQHEGGTAIGIDGQQEEEEEDEDEMGLPDSIKLGLGDFIFYSMLVGRAAMYDMMTVYAAFLAIISGLGITLLLLALLQKALPALPVSIALGVVFYFLTRLTLEPFLVPLAANLAYY